MAKRKTTKAKDPKKQQGGSLLSSAALAKSMGVNRRQPDKWRKLGCPAIHRTVKGRKRFFFDQGKVKEWMSASGYNVRTSGTKPIESPPPPPPAQESDKNDINKAGPVGQLARARLAERLAYRNLHVAMQSDPPRPMSEIQARIRVFSDTSKNARMVEKDTPKILESRGESIPLETVLAECARIDAGIKTVLVAMPKKLALQLSTMTNPAEVETLLTREVDDALRFIASGQAFTDAPPE